MPSLLEIIFAFMKIGVLAFGGGYAAIPLIEEQIVERYGWMTYLEFSDIMAIDELTPGPVLINAATFVGMKLCGIPGAVAATVGSVIPSCIIALVLVKLYYRYRSMKLFDGALSGLRCMVVALIGATALNMFFQNLLGSEVLSQMSPDIWGMIIAAAAFVLLRKYKANPIYVILGCGAAGLAFYSLHL